MRPAVLQFVVWALEASRVPPGEVLDVGSCDVNGSPRKTLEGKGWKYTGFDADEGPNVDVVGDVYVIQKYFEATRAFDCVMCLETLEHLKDPYGAVMDIKTMLRPGGLLILTVAGNGFPMHRHPLDCWRILPDGMASLMGGMTRYTVTEIDEHHELGVAAWAIK